MYGMCYGIFLSCIKSSCSSVLLNSGYAGALTCFVFGIGKKMLGIIIEKFGLFV